MPPRKRSWERLRRTCLYYLDALGGQGLGSGLADVAGDSAEFEFLGEHGVCEDGSDDGAALVAGGAEDGENFGHFCGSRWDLF